MKHGPSLEDERRALLEHIHATRAAYRRMLTEIDEAQEAPTAQQQYAGPDDPLFPRSMTMRWIMEHPYAAVGAVAGTVGAIVLLAPRVTRMVARRRDMRSNQAAGPFMSANPVARSPVFSQGYDAEGRPIAYDAQGRPVALAPSFSQPAMPPSSMQPHKRAPMLALGRAAATSLATTAMMVLRDPAKLRMAMRLFTTASDYLRRRRENQQAASQHPVERHQVRQRPTGYP